MHYSLNSEYSCYTIKQTKKWIALLMNMLVYYQQPAAAPQKPKRPAYEGAKFDVDGYCLVHRKVRLCSVADDGRYKAVRKICPKCGTHSLTRRKSGHIHGSSPKKKEEPIRPLSGLVLQLPGRRHSAGSTEQMSDDSDDSRLSEGEQDEREIEQFRQQPGLRASSLRMARRKITKGW